MNRGRAALIAAPPAALYHLVSNRRGRPSSPLAPKLPQNTYCSLLPLPVHGLPLAARWWIPEQALNPCLDFWYHVK